METPKIIGQKNSSLFFNKVEIYSDRLETKALLMPKKVMPLSEITSWIEINKKHPKAKIYWQEFTVFAGKKKYMFNSLHWKNYEEMKAFLSAGKQRDTAKENKIYGR